MKNLTARWQADFFAGLVIIFPAVLSVWLLVWLFGIVSEITDKLLIFVPEHITHQQNGTLRWYWSVIAFLIALLSIGMIGRLARHYIGKKLIQLVDFVFLRVPLVNKIYGAIKQINQAFTSGEKTSFRQVVLVEFPKDGLYSIAFLTNDRHPEAQIKTCEPQKLVSVVIPTTPNPTTGFLVLVPEDKVIYLEMSVAEGIKLLMSLGTISPEIPSPIAQTFPFLEKEAKDQFVR